MLDDTTPHLASSSPSSSVRPQHSPMSTPSGVNRLNKKRASADDGEISTLFENFPCITHKKNEDIAGALAITSQFDEKPDDVFSSSKAISSLSISSQINEKPHDEQQEILSSKIGMGELVLTEMNDDDVANENDENGDKKKRHQTNWMNSPTKFNLLQKAVDAVQAGGDISEISKKMKIPYRTLWGHKDTKKLVYKKRGGSRKNRILINDKSLHSSTVEHIAEMSVGGWNNNKDLIKHALKCHHMHDSNKLIVDLTNGEGKFTPAGDCYPSKGPHIKRFDKYKNNLVDEVLYGDVMPYDEEIMKTFYNQVDVVMYDPPYASIRGKHNALNCVFKKSQGRLKFNDAYGVNYCYTDAQIHYFYIMGFEMAAKLLNDNGIVMMKVMNFKHLQMRDNLVTLGNCCDFVLYGRHYTLVDKSKTGEDTNSDIGSSLLLFKKAGVKQNSLIRMYGGEKTIEDNIKTNITSSALNDYREYVKKSVAVMKFWTVNGTKLIHWMGDSREMDVSIPKRFRDAIEKCTNEHGKWCKLFEENMLKNILEASVDTLQDRALLIHRIELDLRNYVAFVWEGVLKKSKIKIEMEESRDEKKALAKQITGNKKFANALNNPKSHSSLSENLNQWRESIKM